MTLSFSGMVSGLDTTGLINQLMQLEAQPQTMLKTRVSTQEKVVSALQTINSKLAAVGTKVEDLRTLSGWAPLSVSSSSEHVTATATSSAAAGTFSFTIGQTAAAHRLSFASTAALSDVVTSGSTAITITRPDGTSRSIETGDGTLQSVVNAINNDAAAGVRASTLKLSDGSYRLILEATSTGAASSFTVTNSDGSALLGGTTNADGSSRVVAGRDAKVTVGTDVLTSSTNSFTGVVSGIDFTLAPGAPTDTKVDLTIARDAEAMAESVKGMVDALNAALAEIDKHTAYDANSKNGGVLAGDSTMRALRNELLATVNTAVGGRSLAAVGIELDRGGRVTFDEQVFADAYAVDPTGVGGMFAGTATWDGTGTVTMLSFDWRTQPGPHTVNSTDNTIDDQPAKVSGSVLTGADGTSAAGLSVTVAGSASGTLTFSQGFAARLEAAVQRATDSVVGTVTSAIKGRTSTIDDMSDAIDAWDRRLEIRREALHRQYAALEVALGQLQNQSSWLSGQLAGLPTYS